MRVKLDIMFVIGLPGSGKTYYCNQLDPKVFNVIDDISDLYALPLPAKADNRTLVLSSPQFCFPHTLEQAKKQLKILYPACTMSYVYFENDSAKCEANVEHRDDKREVKGFIKLASNHYIIPEGVKPLAIFSAT